MKSKKLKYTVWGAVVFGIIHMVLIGYCMKEGGDTAMAIIFIDYPLYVLGGLIAKIFPYLNKIVAKDIYYQMFGLVYYLGLGTLMYCLVGSLIGLLFWKTQHKQKRTYENN